jgi:hypothetical protein
MLNAHTQLAHQIQQLVLSELGEQVDLGLLLGPPAYARAVISLCRSCGSAELRRVAEQFVLASQADVLQQRRRTGELAAGRVTAAVSADAPVLLR